MASFITCGVQMSDSKLQTMHLNSAEDIDWQFVVSECEPRIANWCRRFGLQAADATDISQDVLLKTVVWLRSGKIDSDRGHLLSWLKVVTDNAVCTFLKKKTSRPECSLEQPQAGTKGLCRNSLTESLVCSEPNDLEAADESLNTRLQEAESCVQPRVRPGTWEAYRLTMHENLSAGRTAKLIGISVQDVYVAKCRVIGYLKRELGFTSVSGRVRVSQS